MMHATDGGPPGDHDAGREGWPEFIAVWAASLATLGMLVLVFFAIVARNLFSYSIDIVEEYSGYLLVASFFLSLASCQSTGSFHRVQILRSRLSPNLLSRIYTVLLVFALIACLVLFFYLARFELITWERGETSNTTVFTPLAIPRFVMPLGVAILCYALIKDIVRSIRRPDRSSAEGIDK